MGNPQIRIHHDGPPLDAPDMSKVNGVLSRIGGQYIGGTADKLPPAQAGELPERQVVIDVPDLGRVRITYMLARHRHYRTERWSWRAVWADKEV